MVREQGTSYPERMPAARLHGPSDLRIDEVPHPGPPGPGQVLLHVSATGLCGSDLHSYADARIGDTSIPHPLVLGLVSHRFSLSQAAEAFQLNAEYRDRVIKVIIDNET